MSNWNFLKFALGYGPADAWTGQHFYLNWAVRISAVLAMPLTLDMTMDAPLTPYSFQTTVLYFLVDLIWVASVPICVKSPGVIIKVTDLEAYR